MNMNQATRKECLVTSIILQKCDIVKKTTQTALQNSLKFMLAAHVSIETFSATNVLQLLSYILITSNIVRNVKSFYMSLPWHSLVLDDSGNDLDTSVCVLKHRYMP